MACTQGACLTHGDHHRWQEGPQGIETVRQAFRQLFRQPGEKSGKAEEEAGVSPKKPVPSRQPLRQAQVAQGVPALHPGCISLPRVAPQSGKKDPGDGDWMPSFQGNIKSARGEKQRGRGGGWVPPLDAGVFPADPAPSPWGSQVPWLAPRIHVYPTRATQSGKKSSKGRGQDARLSGVHLSSPGRKAARLRRRLGSSPGGQCLPRSQCTRSCWLVGSLDCTQCVCIFHTGQNKVASRTPGDGTRRPAFRGTLRQLGEKSGEAKEEAAVLFGRPVPPWQAMPRVRKARGFPGLHTECVSLTGGIPKRQEDPWKMGTGRQTFWGT